MDISNGSARHLIIFGFAGMLLASCGGGGGSSNSTPPAPPPPPAPDTQAPTAKINFPTEQALTTADNITVAGTATDPEGNAISSVTVNGVAATSTNDFASWTVSIPLTAGDNTITVETADDQSNNDASAASITIKNEVALLNPNDIALDSAGNRALLVDEVLMAIVAVDLSNGQRSVVSGENQGSGALFNTPSTIVLDSANSRTLVGDGTQIIAVDLATGDRSAFVDLGSGNQAVDLTLDEDNARLLVVTPNGVLAVPPSGGAASDFSSATAGSGPAFNAPASIVVDSGSNRALVVDSADAAVIAVDLSSGDRSTFASAAVGLGTNLQTPLSVTLSSDASNALVTDLGSASVDPMIVSIDLLSQARTVLSAGGSTPTGSGQDFSFPVAIVADSANNRSLVVDPALAVVLGVDDTNGNREAVSSASVGGGEAFNGPFNIEYDASNDRALVTDNASQAIYAIDLDTGARTILSGGGVGSGTEFQFPLNLAISDSLAFVTDADTASVLSVDLGSGDRTVLASNIGANANKSPLGIALDSSNDTLYLSVIENDSSQTLVGSELFSLPTNSAIATPVVLSGTGFTSLAFAQNLIIDSNAGTAFLADTAADILFAVTLAGGDTSNLAPITNTVPSGIAPFQDVTLVGGQAVLVDSSLASVVGIDSSSGARSIVSGGTTGNGIALQSPTGVAYASSRDVLLVVDNRSFAIFAVDPNSGDRVIISR